MNLTRKFVLHMALMATFVLGLMLVVVAIAYAVAAWWLQGMTVSGF